ncbi:MAG: amidophosphoribosyltransferase [Candidatus Diapherotrites archaeon]|nr:amidophosphoribosyltransferase [Candidatus Diapherotrites archaeon]
MHENCGIAAVSKNEKGVIHDLLGMLIQQQHRGQLSAGVSTYNSERQQLLDTYKNLGLVNEAFKFRYSTEFNKIVERYDGTKGIGHVRYATSGANDVGAAQPFERHHGRIWKWFSFAFNGNIANFSELKEELAREQYRLVRNLDTELIMHFIAKEFIGTLRRPLEEVFASLSRVLDGAYNIAFINAANQLAVIRDPLGFKPLSFIVDGNNLFAASESVALTHYEKKIKSLKPGEMLIVENESVERKRFAKSKRKAVCMFEFVYFAHPISEIDNISIYNARWRLGKELAKRESLKPDKNTIVVPVPDTAKPAATSYALEIGAEFKEGLIRNKYIGRTFIEGTNRTALVREKYSFNKRILKGKNVILIDDSIVRGTTTKEIVKIIKEKCKAKSVHLRISCPPIVAPCFYGIDMTTLGELLMPNYVDPENAIEISEKTFEKIAKELSADSLIYQSIEGLVDAIKIPKRELCLACLTGDYPTPCGRRLFKKALENFHNNSVTVKRTYE